MNRSKHQLVCPKKGFSCFSFRTTLGDVPITAKNSAKDSFYLNGLFFFGYFSIGSMLPLLSVYLENLGFTGVEIGSIFSIRAITCIFIPPVWGLLSDRFHNHKQLLLVTFILSLVTSVLLPFAKSFILFALAYAFFNIFQTATGPLSDSVALHSSIPFGSIRKWGSYGFAIAALIAGYASRVFGVSVIFVVFGVSTLVAIASTLQLNVHVESSEHNMKDELRLLLRNKKFLVFLFYSFLIGGTIMSHNTFFGIFYKSLGGNVAWIGLAFFLFAISEVPFITLTSRLISRFGIFNVLIFSTLTGIFRWFFYYSAPSVFLILILFPLQGIFFGTFIAATAEYIKTTISPSVRSTAVTAYAAIFVGGGGACGSYIGGYIYDYINIESVYGFFGLINIVGLFVMLYLKKISLPKT